MVDTTVIESISLSKYRLELITPSLLFFAQKALGPIPVLKDSSTEEDAEADITNSASLYKVSSLFFTVYFAVIKNTLSRPNLCYCC